MKDRVTIITDDLESPIQGGRDAIAPKGRSISAQREALGVGSLRFDTQAFGLGWSRAPLRGLFSAGACFSWLGVGVRKATSERLPVRQRSTV